MERAPLVWAQRQADKEEDVVGLICRKKNPDEEEEMVIDKEDKVYEKILFIRVNIV